MLTDWKPRFKKVSWPFKHYALNFDMKTFCIRVEPTNHLCNWLTLKKFRKRKNWVDIMIKGALWECGIKITDPDEVESSGDHDDARCSLLPNHPPKVSNGCLHRTLSHNISFGLNQTLKKIFKTILQFSYFCYIELSEERGLLGG